MTASTTERHTHRTRVRVRYAETDMMGIVYHGNYLPWFEVGRTTLLKECGLPYRELEAQGYHLPVIELGVKYARPALYDDVLDLDNATFSPPLDVRRQPIAGYPNWAQQVVVETVATDNIASVRPDDVTEPTARVTVTITRAIVEWPS